MAVGAIELVVGAIAFAVVSRLTSNSSKGHIYPTAGHLLSDDSSPVPVGATESATET